MEGYSVKIEYTNMELGKREKVLLKDTTNAVKLDEAVTPEMPIVIHPIGYAVLAIHNEKSDNKDYLQYLVLDDEGNKYTTGSESFWSTFLDIMADMEGEEFDLKVYKLESKNYSGRYFLTCSIM